MTPRQQTTLLVIGDCAVFLAFAVIGLRNHEEGVTLNGILRNAVPFGAGWFVFAALYGLMAPGWYRVPDAPWQRVANAWLPAGCSASFCAASTSGASRYRSSPASSYSPPAS